MRTRFAALAAAALAAGASFVALAPGGSAEASPAPASAAPAAGQLDLTLALTPGDAKGLAALANSHVHRTRAERQQALAQVQPSGSTRSALVDQLRAEGLIVTGGDAWNVKVRGTTAQVEKAFKVTEVGSGDQMHPSADPALPTGVEAVLGLDTRPLFHPLNTPYGYQPSQLRSAYSVTRPLSTGVNTTIATIQFSGWDASSLTHYASEIGTTLGANQYTGVPVDNASTTAVSGGGDVEVALDQETILGQAPAATQRAYFGPNTAQGIEDTYSALATDVTTYGIDAVSTSWGTCEANTNSSYRSAISTAVQRMLANGATFFAATGDDGAYDCTTDTTKNTTLAVDFPASLNYTVAVGGTSLTNPGSPGSQTAWSGSGGGASADYAKPTYQSSLSGTKRLLPDIAVEADPNYGVDVYVEGQDGQYGGTSLAAPMQAAQLADALSSLGCSTGVGDIHALLYAHTADFTDVTSGSNTGTFNGSPIGSGYSAGAGFDEATGLGSPIWSSLALDLQPVGGCSGGDYFPVTPARILDTRNGTGTAQAPLGAGATINFSVLGTGGVPSTGVSAVVLNVTSANPTAATSFLTVWPTGLARPNTSNLNTVAGVNVPNLVTVGVGSGGQVSVWNQLGTTDVIADVQGYYADGTTPTVGSRYFPLTPSRLLDTRNGTGAAQAQLGAGQTLSFPVTGVGGVPSSNVSAVVLNLTAVLPSQSTFLIAYPSGTTQPNVSNLNPAAGQTVPNLAIVPPGSDGKVTVYNQSGSLDLVADVVGYFATSAGTTGSRFLPLSPVRILDTRSGTGAPQAQVGQDGTISLTVAGAGGVPASGVAGAVMNVTATNATAGSFVTVYPGDVSLPNASNLNFNAGQNEPNLVEVRLPTSGVVKLHNQTGSVDLIADVYGYYYS